jgi:hypothetical protein
MARKGGGADLLAIVVAGKIALSPDQWRSDSEPGARGRRRITSASKLKQGGRFSHLMGPSETSDSHSALPSALWELLVHIMVGTLVFVVIALAAVGLDFIVGWLSKTETSIIIIRGLQAAEYFLFLVDLILFFVFVWRTAYRTLKRL